MRRPPVFSFFKNACYLSGYGAENLLKLVVRGFGTGAMHVVCGVSTAAGLLFLWDRLWLRAVGMLSLLSVSITFHAIFNILVNQPGAVSLIGSLIPMGMIGTYLAFVRRKLRPIDR